jgi:predicted HicB family RNase H-like nuclease
MLQPCNFEIIDPAALVEPPEATAEPDQGATLYVRVPASLKARIDGAAREVGLSANSWAMRCLERCMGSAMTG